MISFTFLLLLSLLLIVGLFIKLLKITLSRYQNIIICIVLPLLTISMFLAMLIECNYRRNTDIRTLDKITDIVTKTLTYNKVFKSNKEKEQSLEILSQYKERIDEIAFQDTLITIICGRSDNTTKRILQAKHAVSSQMIRIERLNDYLETQYHIDSIKLSNNIHIQEPKLSKSNALNLVFSFPNIKDSILATMIMVSTNDSVIFNKQYKYKRINSITIPHIPNNKEMIKVGYVTIQNNKYFYNYNLWNEIN